MDIGDWWATGDVVSKSQRGLSTKAHTVEQSLLLNKGSDLNKFLNNEFPKRALEMKFLGVSNHDSHNCVRDKLTSDIITKFENFKLFYLKSSLRSSDLPLTFLCSIVMDFSLPCLLATAILDSFSLF